MSCAKVIIASYLALASSSAFASLIPSDNCYPSCNTTLGKMELHKNNIQIPLNNQPQIGTQQNTQADVMVIQTNAQINDASEPSVLPIFLILLAITTRLCCYENK
ncbi:hypothetical protein HR060_00950 [Catenovulum sp. SM1970]|uniref:hypothetical protein n=1 Tax=Marinifaba aquimaris TaxID=2741323 RepID=UPI001574034B|nr:hypothetical protein [Marinifaba aquimaris]NTS75418.1 hypothetical protein [Marinifaba aquimaris]